MLRSSYIEKKMWLFSFFMVVATYCYFEKVRRTMRTTIALYLFNISTFKIRSNWKHFWFSRMALKREIVNLYSSKALFLSKHSPLKKKTKPAKNDQIWFVVAWYRFFIRRPPFQDDHFWVVLKVVVLYRFDCSKVEWYN